MTPIHATRKRIVPRIAPQHQIDAATVAAMVAHLDAGGRLPPAVVAVYGARQVPIDGHHRLTAYAETGRIAEAWAIDGAAYDALALLVDRPEDFILCDGRPCLAVAGTPTPRAA